MPVIWDEETLGARYHEEPIPESMKAQAEQYREKLIEAAADSDEELLEQYLEGVEISEDRIRKAIRSAAISLDVVPVLCGAAFKNKGIQNLLDAVVDYLPSPLEVPAITGVDPDGAEVSRRLSFVRVYSGCVKSGSHVLNSTQNHRERIGRLVKVHANKREEVEEISAGDIAAIVGLKRVATGDTLCDERAPVILESIEAPEPVIEIVIEPKTKADQEKLSDSLGKLAVEDPSFRVMNDEETGQTLIAGQGELHLEIIVDRLLREFQVNANVGQPQVAYKETITRPVRAEGRYVRQSGGRGQYGHVILEVEPGEPGSGIQFSTKVVGGTVPKEFFKAVQLGVREACETGVLAGFPVVDAKICLVDGSYHEVDSSEIAFKIAGSMGLRDGLERGKSILLEPVMEVEVVAPEIYTGAVIDDLNSRRGRIVEIEARGNTQVISAETPLANMFGYVNSLRSLTQGRATFTMQFHHYAPVPESVAATIVQR
jgi:elongation factor G